MSERESNIYKKKTLYVYAHTCKHEYSQTLYNKQTHRNKLNTIYIHLINAKKKCRRQTGTEQPDRPTDLDPDATASIYPAGVSASRARPHGFMASPGVPSHLNCHQPEPGRDAGLIKWTTRATHTCLLVPGVVGREEGSEGVRHGGEEQEGQEGWEGGVTREGVEKSRREYEEQECHSAVAGTAAEGVTSRGRTRRKRQRDGT